MRAGAIVVATGMWSSPRWPETPRARSLRRSRRCTRATGGVRRGACRPAPAGCWSSAAAPARGRDRRGGGGAPAFGSPWPRARKVRLTPATFLGRDVHHYIGPVERLPPWLARGYCAQLPTLPADRTGVRAPAGRGARRGAGRAGRSWSRAGGPGSPDGIRPGHSTPSSPRRAIAFATPFLPPEVGPARRPGSWRPATTRAPRGRGFTSSARPAPTASTASSCGASPATRALVARAIANRLAG